VTVVARVLLGSLHLVFPVKAAHELKIWYGVPRPLWLVEKFHRSDKNLFKSGEELLTPS
jgi:hypothetical protein